MWEKRRKIAPLLIMLSQTIMYIPNFAAEAAVLFVLLLEIQRLFRRFSITAAQLPTKRGDRFSRNALIPSR